jgi:hypothetical protein
MDKRLEFIKTIGKPEPVDPNKEKFDKLLKQVK